jgi:hypothetical protein
MFLYKGGGQGWQQVGREAYNLPLSDIADLVEDLFCHGEEGRAGAVFLDSASRVSTGKDWKSSWTMFGSRGHRTVSLDVCEWANVMTENGPPTWLEPGNRLGLDLHTPP